MANIKAYIEQAIRSIEAEKEQEIRKVKERVMAEKIVPFNREKDELRDNAVQQKANELNEAIKVLQEQFAKDKADIYAKTEQRKKENAESVISAETAIIVSEYNATIVELKKTLGEPQE